VILCTVDGAVYTCCRYFVFNSRSLSSALRSGRSSIVLTSFTWRFCALAALPIQSTQYCQSKFTSTIIPITTLCYQDNPAFISKASLCLLKPLSFTDSCWSPRTLVFGVIIIGSCGELDNQTQNAVQADWAPEMMILPPAASSTLCSLFSHYYVNSTVEG
jgi:hypothetical protein